jgi:hypothetical protein
MNRTRIVFVGGAVITVMGIATSLRAGSLATNWQPLGAGAWGGTTDPALRQSYQSIGLLTFCFGLVLLALSAWNWIRSEKPASRPPAVVN